MTKIPSVQERVDEFTSKIQKSSKDGGFLNQNDLFPNRFLIAAWLKQTLTADRTALLTELREWAEKIKRCNSSEEHSRRRDHTTKSGYEIALDDFQAYIDNLINPT